MVDVPERIWAASVTENYGEWQTTTDGLPRPTEYIRADLATLSSTAVAEREPVVAAWQFKHYDPISGHPVWKTTLYWNGHRATECRPLYLDPPPASELEAEIARLKARLAEVEKALDGLLEPFEGDDCRYDHHGYCQAHFLQEGDECCVKIARHVLEGGKVDG